MLIGGFQKFSLIDYPGEISAIIFTSGCNFRCPYCHNPELVKMTAPIIAEIDILNFLKIRTGKLSAVSITGGEPTLQKNLAEFIGKIKRMGLLIKLDTNGSNPDMLEELIRNRLIDYVSMDIKAPIDLYAQVIHSPFSKKRIGKSIDIIMASPVRYEFRTTIVKSLLSKDDIVEIGKAISGASNYYLQKFVPSKTLDPRFINDDTYTEGELKEIAAKLEENYVHRCFIR